MVVADIWNLGRHGVCWPSCLSMASLRGLSQSWSQRSIAGIWPGKTPRVVKGAGTVIWPLIESCRLLSLELMSFDVAPQQDLYTNQGVAVTVEAVAQIKVKSDDISIRLGRSSFLPRRLRSVKASFVW